MVFVESQCRIWWYGEVSPFGRWLGLAPLQKRPQRALSPLLPYEDTAKKQLSMKQGAGPHQTDNLLAPWTWNSPSPELWGINLFISHPVWYFWYNNPNQLRYMINWELLQVSTLVSSHDTHHFFPIIIVSWEFGSIPAYVLTQCVFTCCSLGVEFSSSLF